MRWTNRGEAGISGAHLNPNRRGTMLEWEETAILGPVPPVPGLSEPPEPTRKARAQTDDGGRLTATLLGQPPGPMLFVVEFEPVGLEEGEGPDPRAPTLEELGDALRALSPEGAVWGLHGHILARGPDVPYNPGTIIYLRQSGARKGSEAASGLLVVPPGSGPSLVTD